MTCELPVDGRPACITASAMVLVHPHRVELQPFGTGIYAHYECLACGHEWFTGWSAEAAKRPCPGYAECQPEAGAA